jgi:hypothetical protein
MAFAMRLLLLLGIATITIAAAPSPRLEPLSSLLARMRERSGPVWDAHVQADLRTSQDGVHSAVLRSDMQGLDLAVYHCAQGLCDGEYFDGERRWSVDINGTTLPQAGGSDPYERAERTIASLAFLDPNFISDGGSLFDNGYTNISGRRYRTLLVANGDATPMDVFIDPQRATVTYARDINGDNTFEYTEYATIGRLYLPAEILRNGKPFERYTNRTIDAQPFAVPHGPLATFAQGAVTLYSDPDIIIPVIPCSIAGIAARCLLDSGNSGLSIGLGLAERLRLAPIGSFQVRGLGDYATEVVRGGPLRLGTMTFAPADYVVLHDIENYGYDIVLGADLFAATTVELNASAHRVVLGARVPQSGISVPMSFEDFVPVVDVHLGTLPTELAIDTGDESSINLAYDFYLNHHDLFSATTARPVSGVGGRSIEVIGTIPSVQIGTLDVPAPAIGATRTLSGTAYGHVGFGLLSRYDVLIDYSSASLHFISP